MDKALLFLMNLAYKSRIPLSFLITMCFLALDIRMQLEINVQTRRMRRLSHNEDIARGQRARSVDENSSDGSGSFSSSGTVDYSTSSVSTEVSEDTRGIGDNEGVPSTSNGRTQRRQQHLEQQEETRNQAVGINIHLDALRLSR